MGSNSLGSHNYDVPDPEFAVRDVMHTGYPDRQFDAVVCNRLFHHFRESEVRIRALTELRRISRGPVIVSFFNAFAIGAVRFHLKHALRRTVPLRPRSDSRLELSQRHPPCGFDAGLLYAVTWGISPLWHVVSVPTASRIAASGCRRAARLESETAI